MIIESKKILNVPPQSIKFFAHISHDRYVAIVGKQNVTLFELDLSANILWKESIYGLQHHPQYKMHNQYLIIYDVSTFQLRLLVDFKNKSISRIDYRKKQTQGFIDRKYQYSFLVVKAYQNSLSSLQIYTFPNINYFCIQQTTKQHISLNYYSYDDPNNYKKQLKSYIKKYQGYSKHTTVLTVEEINNKQLICYLERTDMQQFVFYIFNLDQKEITYKQYGPGFSQVMQRISIRKFWIKKQNKIYFTGVDRLHGSICKIITYNLLSNNIQLFYEFNEVLSLTDQFIRFKDYCLMGLYHQKDKKFYSYIIDNKRLQINFMGKIVTSKDSIIQNKMIYIQEVKDNKYQIISLDIFSRSQILLHFMLHMNQDYDDDLLQDALKILDVI